MAESDTILQLGIEAAREGNREEARSLFSLLTRQEPDNTQAWLWLAGVAETPDERRAALERVVALDPNNDMARKGLQAIGVDPDTIPAASGSGVTTATPVPTMVSTPPTAADDLDLDDEQRYASELDAAFDDYDTVEKVGGGPRNDPTDYDDDDAAAGGALGGGTARERIASRRNARARAYEDDDDELPPRRGPSTLLLTLIGAILVLLLGFFLWQFFANRGDGGTAGVPTSVASETAGAGGTGDGTTTAGDGTGTLPGSTGDVSGTGTITSTGDVSGTGTVSGTGEVPPVAPAETPQVQPPVAGNFPDPATANPQQVGIGTQLEASGFSYTFPSANYAANLPGTVGSATSSTGRFVVVLAYVANNTGSEQTVPADLFVLKDAQGRVYTTNAAASKAYVQPGVNADKSLEDTLPADGTTYSVALVFDVAPDATGLVLFTRPNQGQGFLVLP